MTLRSKLCLVLSFIGATDSWAMERANEDVSPIRVKGNRIYDSDDDISTRENPKKRRIISDSDDDADEKNDSDSFGVYSSNDEYSVDDERPNANIFTRMTDLIKGRKDVNNIQEEFGNVKKTSLIRYIEEAITKGLLNDVDDVHYAREIKNTLRNLNTETPDYLKRYADLVRRQAPLEEIETAFPGATRESLYKYTYYAKKAGLLSENDTAYLDSRIEAAYYSDFVDLVRQRKTLEVLLAFYGEKRATQPRFDDPTLYRPWEDFNENEKKERLNRVFSKLYKKGLLTSADTLYLKEPNTVIGVKGDTKQHILEFLKEACRENRTAGSKAELLECFNLSEFRAARNIARSTFADHINEMIKDGRIGPDLRAFLARCKGRTRR